MELADLFQKAEHVERHMKRAASKRIKPSTKHLIENPEILSPEAYRHYAKESTGVAQRVSVRYTRDGRFLYISHSVFK